METPMFYGKHIYVNEIGNEAMHKKSIDILIICSCETSVFVVLVPVHST